MKRVFRKGGSDSLNVFTVGYVALLSTICLLTQVLLASRNQIYWDMRHFHGNMQMRTQLTAWSSAIRAFLGVPVGGTTEEELLPTK